MAGVIHPLFDLGGRIAVVTGGGSGLGREFCDVLAEFGADVVCPDIHKSRAEETCEIVKKYGHKVLPMKVDVSQYGQVQALFKQVEETFGRLDILVNNAGITSRSAIIDQTDVSDWHRVINVNLNGVFYCMKEGLKLMLKRKRGSIINISSIAGMYAEDPDIISEPSYIAAKAGIIGLTRQGAAEYGRHGIRVNCIAPGWHLGTRLGEGAGATRTEEESRELLESLISRTPLKRTGEPGELKGLLLYLASDASSFMTGAIIPHDGGWTCW